MEKKSTICCHFGARRKTTIKLLPKIFMTRKLKGAESQTELIWMKIRDWKGCLVNCQSPQRNISEKPCWLFCQCCVSTVSLDDEKEIIWDSNIIYGDGPVRLFQSCRANFYFGLTKAVKQKASVIAENELNMLSYSSLLHDIL